MRLAITGILIAFLLTGCTLGRGSGVFPPAADIQAQPPVSAEDDGRDYRILIANGLSETITLVERESGMWNVTPDVLQTGQSPSQIVVKDGLCYIVNSLSNSIQVIDPIAMTTIREVSTGSGTNPMFMEFVDDSSALVTCYLSNEAVLIDLSADTLTEERILGRIAMPDQDELPKDEGKTTDARPGGIAVVDDTAYVACANLEMAHVAGGHGIIVQIDIPSLAIVGTIELDGRDTVSVIRSLRFPNRLIAISAGDYDPGIGFTGNGLVESIDLISGEIVQGVEVNGAPFGGVIGADDILVMENGMESKVLRVDLRKGVELDSYSLPTYGEPLSYASSILALPGLICVTNFNADRLCLVDPANGDILAELATGDGPDAIALIE